jgi:hypothetical protein
MRGYLTKRDWRHGRPDHGWWVELLKDGERVAYNISLDEWRSRQSRR